MKIHWKWEFEALYMKYGKNMKESLEVGTDSVAHLTIWFYQGLELTYVHP